VSREGLLVAIGLTILSLLFLWVLGKLLPRGGLRITCAKPQPRLRPAAAEHERRETMNNHSDVIERLEALERRVSALEHPLAAHLPRPATEPKKAFAPQTAGATASATAKSIFSVMGIALLGIAGAYVLRALEQTGPLPRIAAAGAGIVYAFLWLAWAAHVRGGPRFTSSIYAATSALILAPMLWELTLRFKVLPAPVAAVLVCGYALATFALQWKHDLKPVVRVACIAAAGLALALAVASHAFLPFVVALLVLAAVCEFVPGCDRVPEVAALVALATDAAIWVFIYVYFARENALADYPTLSRGALLAPGIAVFVLFTASVCVKTLLHARPITAFETVQTVIAFVLAAVSLADFGQPDGTEILGVACLILSAACYAAVFTVFARSSAERNTTVFAPQRNAAVFAAWAAALVLSGSVLWLPPLPRMILLGAAALAAMGVSRHPHWTVFEFYGMVFLLAAAAASGLLDFLVSALVGTPSGAPAAGMWLIAVCAVLCYLLAQSREGERWRPQVLHLGFAALAASALAALLVDGLFALTALSVTPGVHHLALIRTVALCAAALVLVSGGAHWRRRELTRLGYAALGLVAVKLVTEDLRHGHLGYIAASIFLVALTLIAAPRVARARQKA